MQSKGQRGVPDGAAVLASLQSLAGAGADKKEAPSPLRRRSSRRGATRRRSRLMKTCLRRPRAVMSMGSVA